MKKKNIIAKSMLFAAAFGFVGLVGSTQAKATPPSATFSADKAELSSEAAKFWGIAKEIKGKNAKRANLQLADSKFYQVTNIEDVLNKTIDLSNFNTNKDITFAIGTKPLSKADKDAVSTEWTVVTVKAVDASTKIFFEEKNKKFGKYTPTGTDNNILGAEGAGFLAAIEGTKKVQSIALTGFEVHNGNGNWSDFGTFFGGTGNDNVKTKLTALREYGATLTFRKKGVATTSNEAFTGKEIKVKIPAYKAGPKITIKGDKVSGLKKGTEYKAQETTVTTEPAAGALTATEDPKKVGTLGEIGVDGSKSMHLYVRTKATEKKAASKFTKLTLTNQKKPELANSKTAQNTLVEAGGEADIMKDSKVHAKLKVPYDMTKGAEIVNAGDNDYEFYISYAGEAVTNPKWILLKKAQGEEKKPTKVNVKYSKVNKANTYGAEGSKIYFRLAGGKQVGNAVVIPSQALELQWNMKGVDQALTVAADTNSTDTVELADSGKTAKLKNIEPKKAITYNLLLKVTNLTKKDVKPRIKADKKKGISLEVGEFVADDNDKNGKAPVTVTVSEEAFPAEVSGSIKLEVSIEGVKDAIKLEFVKKTD